MSGLRCSDCDSDYLRAFLDYLISFDWSESLIDSAYAFSLAIEQQIARGAS